MLCRNAHLYALLLLAWLAFPGLAQPVRVEACIFEPTLELPLSLEPRRAEFRDILLRAQRRLLGFAKRHDWDFLMREPLMGQVKIFDSKLAYDAMLNRLYPESQDKPIPASVVAGFEADLFFAVSPEIYQKNVPQFVEPAAYEKLITHELAHRLHIRLVNGNEEKMGPMWFWEGLATFAAGQFEDDTTALGLEEVKEVLDKPERGDYRKYNRTLRFFVKLVPLPEMVRRSTRSDFNSWLLENANP